MMNAAETPIASPQKPALLCGVGPVPLGPTERLFAPGLRLLTFARALLITGRPLRLLEVRFGETENAGTGILHTIEWQAQPGPFAPLRSKSAQKLSFQHLAELVQKAIQKSQPACLVATTDVMNDACAQSAGKTPLWCDYNGHCMAERQSLARTYDNDVCVPEQWAYLLAPLLRADRFSACSQPQRLAMLGELGACGRLNRHTDELELVYPLHPAVSQSTYPKVKNVFRGKNVPEDAFVILWTGGYNTWADVDTLADGLTSAMEANPRIHYVSTGGSLTGHDEKSFARFQEKVVQSSAGDRFHFAGWVPTGEVPDYYLEADLAIQLDRPNLEGELGCRNRVMEWVMAGLPVLTTPLSEITRDLTARDLVHGVRFQDAEGLCQKLLDIAHMQPEALKQKANAARDYLLESYHPEKLYAPLAQWCAHPQTAPDLIAPAHKKNVPFPFPDNGLASLRADEWLRMHAPQKNAFLKKLLGERIS